MRAVCMAVTIAAALFFITSEFYVLHVGLPFSVNIADWTELEKVNFTDLKHLFQAAKLVIY